MTLENGYIHLMNSCDALATARIIQACIAKSKLLNYKPLISSSLIHMLGRFGRVEAAKQVFDNAVQHHYSCTLSMLTVFIQNNLLRDAKALLESMPHVCSSTWTSLFTAYARTGDLESTKGLFDSMPHHSLVICTSMLTLYSENGLIEQASAVFRSVPEWDVVLWTMMLTAYSRNNKDGQARSIFINMPEHNLACSAAMLVLFARRGEVKLAKCLFDTMPEHDIVTWTSMLKACSIGGNLKGCRVLFDSMPERNLVSWNVMLGAYAQNSELENVRAVFDEMLECDVASWNSFLAAFVRDGHLDQARSLFQEMPELNTVSCNTMLYGSGGLRETKQMFDGMLERDIVSWTVMFCSYFQHGQLAQARRIKDQMPEHDLTSLAALVIGFSNSNDVNSALHEFFSINLSSAGVPSEACFAAVLGLCNHKGGLYAARCHFLAITIDFGKKPSKQHYCCMVDLLARAGFLHEALELIGSMPFVPDVHEWASLLASSRRHVDLDHGFHAARHVLALSGSGLPYVLLSNLCSLNHRSFTGTVLVDQTTGVPAFLNAKLEGTPSSL